MRFLAIMTTALMLAQPVLADQPSTLTVSGTGHVTRAPDMATLMVGVTTQGDTASEALGANSDQLAAVMARLKEAGIAENDIQTSGLSLNPRYESSSSGDAPVIHGYEAANTVSVTVHDLDALGGVLDQVVADGANTLGGLSFGLEDDTEAMDAARRTAVADAQRKAALYAEAAGVKLGRILSITEAGSAMPQPMMAMGGAMFAREASVPIAQGALDLESSVSVSWELLQ